MNDATYLKIAYRLMLGSKLDLNKPQTYNEKLQWLKINDHNPVYTTIVDKYEVKQYVSKRIGENYIIPTLGVYETFDEINFADLPSQFVLKCTHDSGGLAICKDKATFDIKAARKKINKCLKRNYYWQGREWPYKNVKPRIIAEAYMEDSYTSELRDYKFFAFDGIVKALFIATERQKVGEDTKFDFFDAEYNHLDMRHGHPNAEMLPEKPINFELMKKLASELSKGIPQVRVDFYEVNGIVYFGEMTLFHHGGLVPFDPQKWDNEFGSWIELSSVVLQDKKT